MKVTLCDICKQEKEIYFKCKIKQFSNNLDLLYYRERPTWVKAEICEDCLNKLKSMKGAQT